MSAIAERLGRELSRAASIDDEPRRDQLVREALDESLARLQAWPLAAEELRLASSLLWNPNAAWLDQGVLLTRARRKPLGYAGDYQLLRWIVERSVPGVTPLGQSLDRYFQTESAPRAVRERTRRVASDLAEQARRPGRPLRWLSVGSGPAEDVFQALNDVDERRRLGIRVELWDLDPRGLKAAESRLAPLMARDQLHVRRRNLFRIADDPPDDPLYDAVICSGFFDYLDPQQAVRVGARLWRATAPKGWLQVFNFDGGHGSRGYMEWFGSWFLIYRDRAAMQSLAHALDAPGAVEGLVGDAIWRLRMDRP